MKKKIWPPDPLKSTVILSLQIQSPPLYQLSYRGNGSNGQKLTIFEFFFTILVSQNFHFLLVQSKWRKICVKVQFTLTLATYGLLKFIKILFKIETFWPFHQFLSTLYHKNNMIFSISLTEFFTNPVQVCAYQLTT